MMDYDGFIKLHGEAAWNMLYPARGAYGSKDKSMLDMFAPKAHEDAMKAVRLIDQNATGILDIQSRLNPKT